MKPGSQFVARSILAVSPRPRLSQNRCLPPAAQLLLVFKEVSYSYPKTRCHPESGKAQFGTAVWLNGRKIGEHMGCFTAGFFDLTRAIQWSGENVLVIRIGAHPGVVPREVPTGTDYEKYLWTPGIYDSVTLALSGDPVIETVQIGPRLQTSSIVVETVLRNYSKEPAEAMLTHKITNWKGGAREWGFTRPESGPETW